MHRALKASFIGILLIILVSIIITIFWQVEKSSKINDADLIRPKSITIDRSLNQNTIDQMIKLARLYYTFWNTGEYKYLNASLASNFNIHNNNQTQNEQGLKTTYYNFKKAFPNFNCSVEDLLIVGNKISSRLICTGLSEGNYLDYPPTKKPTEFNAIDILQVEKGKINQIWHLQDNFNLFQQLGMVKLVK